MEKKRNGHFYREQYSTCSRVINVAMAVVWVIESHNAAIESHSHRSIYYSATCKIFFPKENTRKFTQGNCVLVLM